MGVDEEDRLLTQLHEAAEEVEMIEAAMARHVNEARAKRDRLLREVIAQGVPQTKAARAAKVSRGWVFKLLKGEQPGRRKIDKLIGVVVESRDSL